MAAAATVSSSFFIETWTLRLVELLPRPEAITTHVCFVGCRLSSVGSSVAASSQYDGVPFAGLPSLPATGTSSIASMLPDLGFEIIIKCQQKIIITAKQNTLHQARSKRRRPLRQNKRLCHHQQWGYAR